MTNLCRMLSTTDFSTISEKVLNGSAPISITGKAASWQMTWVLVKLVKPQSSWSGSPSLKQLKMSSFILHTACLTTGRANLTNSGPKLGSRSYYIRLESWNRSGSCWARSANRIINCVSMSWLRMHSRIYARRLRKSARCLSQTR